jgi:hypothetical protein
VRDRGYMKIKAAAEYIGLRQGNYRTSDFEAAPSLSRTATSMSGLRDIKSKTGRTM